MCSSSDESSITSSSGSHGTPEGAFYFLGSAGDWAPKSSRKKRSRRYRRSGDFLDGVYGDWIEISKKLKQTCWEVSGASISVGGAARPQEELRKLQCFADQQGHDVKLLYYSGHGKKGTGDWAFDGGTVGLEDILNLFGKAEKRRRISDGGYREPANLQKLIIIADCCYSGRWADQLTNARQCKCGFAITLIFASGPKEYAIDGLLREALLKGENSGTMRKLARRQADVVWSSPAGQLLRMDMDDPRVCSLLQSWLFKGTAIPDLPSEILVEVGPAAVRTALKNKDPRVVTAALDAATQLDSDEERSGEQARKEIRRISRVLEGNSHDVGLLTKACDALASRVNDRSSKKAAVNEGVITSLLRLIPLHTSGKTPASRELLRKACKALLTILRGSRGSRHGLGGHAVISKLANRKGLQNEKLRKAASRLLQEL